VTAAPGREFASILAGITSTEARLAATAGILLAALFAGWLLVPRLVRTGQRLLARWLGRLLEGRGDGYREALAAALPTAVALRALVGVLQVGLFAAAGAAVLTLWGRFDLVLAAVPVAESALSIAVRLAITAALFGGAYVASDVLEGGVEELSADSDQITAHQQQLLTRIVQVGLLVVASITTLGVWGVNLGGLLVGAGFLGIVVGMAARQTLGSLIAGFVLMFSRPFEVGDWVEIGDEEGFVTEITIMNTHLRNFDGEFVVLPNDKVTDTAITNRSREGRLRIHIEVGIGYDDDPDRASDLAREAIEALDLVENNPPPHVVPSAFGDSAITLDVRYWIAPPTPQGRWRSKAAVVNAINARFDEAGITIPFPQRTLNRGPVPPEVDPPAASEPPDPSTG